MIAAYPFFEVDLSSGLSKPMVPTLLYAGSKDPVVEQLKIAVKELKNGEFKILDGLDHGEVYWGGDLGAKLIKSFLKAHNL